MLIPFGVFSAGAGGGDSGGGSFDLISTTLLTGSQASVTFDVTGLGATYKHLQVRYAARSNTAYEEDSMRLRFNADSGANYTFHQLFAQGSSVTSSAATGQTGNFPGVMSSGGAAANLFGVGVIDILDAFNTSKNKTIRGLSGNVAGAKAITLRSGAWLNTAAVTSVVLNQVDGSAFAASSRFSIYGVK